MEELIRVLVVDDHEVVRKGLCSLLTPKYQVEVIGEAVDGIDAIEKARELNPDVILMDMMMPRMSGVEAITEIKRETPDSRIVGRTSFSDDSKIVAAIRAGAAGYVMKHASPDELVHTIHSAHLGNLTLSEDMFKLVVSDSSGVKPVQELNQELTDREVEVLRERGQGSSNQQSAEALSVSTTTVRTHVSNILSKLELDNRTQAAIYARDAGLIN